MPESTNQMWTHIVQAQEIVGWLTEMYAANKGLTILGYEIVWLILFWTLLPWRLSKSPSWGGKVWTQTWLSLVYWAGAIWLIPASQWGDPYRHLLSYSLKALFKMLLA